MSLCVWACVCACACPPCSWETEEALQGYEAEVAAYHARRSIMEEAKDRQKQLLKEKKS